MKNRLILAFFLFLIGALLFSVRLPASASPAFQTVPSPTPGADGQIIYIVKAGETCTQIEAMFGITDVFLRTANVLDTNCDLREGQRLTIGVGGPSVASPTPGSTPTPTLAPATPTPEVGGSAQVCVLVYNDLNGDGLRQGTEVAIAGAAVSLTGVDGPYSQSLTTAVNSDPNAYQGMCFTNVPRGKYTVSAAAPENYNPTINFTSNVEVAPGDTAYVDFGAQLKTTVATSQPKGPSPLFGIIGALFLLGGIGLGVYAWSILRRK
jgi:hypothetical protein